MKKTFLIAIMFLAAGCTWSKYVSAPVSTSSNVVAQTAVDPYPTTTEGWKTFTNKSLGFSFQYPADWNLQKLAPPTNKNYYVPYLLAEFISPFCKQAGVACYNGSDLSVYYYPTVSDFIESITYQNGTHYDTLSDVMKDQNAPTHSTGNTMVASNPAYLVSIGGNGSNEGVIFQKGNSVYELSFNTLADDKVYTGASTNLESLLTSTWKFQ